MTALPPDDQLLYTLPAAGRVLGMSRVTVHRLITRGELAAVYKDGRRRVTRRALEEYVRGLERDAARVIAAVGA